MSDPTPIGVLGGGAWGTALAQMLAADGREVRLWAREPEVVAAINEHHENTLFLPGHPLSGSLRASGEIGWVAGAATLLVVAPAQHVRAVLATLPAARHDLVLCAKGIEAASGLLMHQVAEEVCPDAAVAVLSGPTFAHEVARGHPTAVTLAHADHDAAATLAEAIARPGFRPYLSDDRIGTEIGGAVKNVLAIACGVVEGRGLGQNARAALIARGFAEMIRFGTARGGRIETLAGLSGLGDVVLTCSSTSSRNFSLGKGLGEGRAAADLLADRRTVAEGAATAPVLVREAEKAGVDMPIAAAVCRLLAGETGVEAVVGELLARPIKPETN